MGKILKFEYMYCNEVSARIEFDITKQAVRCEELTDSLPHQFFGKREHTVDNLLDVLEERCFESSHHAKDKILEYLGLMQYNPLDIIRVTHGALMQDNIWIRFDGEDITYDQVRSYIYDC